MRSDTSGTVTTVGPPHRVGQDGGVDHGQDASGPDERAEDVTGSVLTGSTLRSGLTRLAYAARGDVASVLVLVHQRVGAGKGMIEGLVGGPVDYAA